MSGYEELRPFATPRQLEILDALGKHGSQAKAAKALGVAPRRIEKHIQHLKGRAAIRGLSPEHDMTHPVPEPFLVKGVSTMYTPEGIAAQWVKTDIDRERRLELAQEVVDAMSESIKREKPVSKPAKKRYSEDLLDLYLITDFHLGMYSWNEETGQDWDTDIAEETLVAWFERAITTSPDASVGLLALLGDLLHWDGMEAVTPEHRNILDADTRFEKLVRVAIRVIRRIVRLLLAKHDRVHMVIAEGNHDPASSAWLRELFAALYENEPRVTVDRSPNPYYCFEFGKTSLFFHHGHKRNLKNVHEVFAGKFREEFGRTKHAYGHVGHKHEQGQHESNLMVVESHRTLAAPDAYSARGGWLSGRGASVITYSREYGEVGRVTISPEMCRG